MTSPQSGPPPRRFRLPAFSRQPEVERSLRHSIRDGVSYSVMTGAGETYFSAFAVLLKASPAQIGLLAALPQLLASLAQLFSAWLGHRTQRRLPIILLGARLQALSWLPLIVLPLAFPQQAVPLMIGCVVLYYIGANLAIPQWSSLMGDLVPKRRRGRYFALRTRLASITAFFSLIGAGLLLHLFERNDATMTGFLALFAIAMAARFVSIHHLKQMHDAPGHVSPLELPNWRLWRSQFLASPFAIFSLFYALMQFATAISSPFFTVYLLCDLQFSYLLFTLNTGMIILAQFLTLNWWGRIADTLGNRLILVITGSVIPTIPLLWVLSTDVWYLMLLQALGGLVWAGFSLCAGNFIYDALPPHKRVTLMALHNSLANIGVFAGALIGGYLATHLDRELTIAGQSFAFASVFHIIFLLSALGRAMVAAAFLPRIREMRLRRPTAMRELIFRVSRFNALWGLFFDVVGSRRRPLQEMRDKKDTRE